MKDVPPPPPPGPHAKVAQPAPPAGNTTAKPEPSPQEIAAILERVEQEHRARFPVEPKSPAGCLTGWATGTLTPRLLFAAAGMILISQGIDGLRTRAVSSDSLIAVSINKQGAQSLGLGVAILACATLPYPARKGE